MSEDPTIADYGDRKSALRKQVAHAGPDAHAVFAADKVTKTRELRAQAARGGETLASSALQRRLEHYENSLRMLQREAPDLPLVSQLAFELWAMRTLPPRAARSAVAAV